MITWRLNTSTQTLTVIVFTMHTDTHKGAGFVSEVKDYFLAPVTSWSLFGTMRLPGNQRKVTPGSYRTWQRNTPTKPQSVIFIPLFSDDLYTWDILILILTFTVQTLESSNSWQERKISGKQEGFPTMLHYFFKGRYGCIHVWHV